jgi:hypothetical protein
LRLEHVGSASPQGGGKYGAGSADSMVGMVELGVGTGVSSAGGKDVGGGLGGDCAIDGLGVVRGASDGSTVGPQPARTNDASSAMATPIGVLRRARNDLVRI